MTAEKRKIKFFVKSVKGRILLAGLLFVLALTAFLVSMGIKKIIKWNKSAETIFEPVFPLQPEQVIGIDVRGRGERVSLEWREDTWYFTHLADARANTRAVRYFLEKICHWIPEQKYSVLKQSGNETDGDVFGFKDQSVRYVLSDQIGKQYTVTSGGYEKTTNRIFARTEETETVFLLPKIAFIEMDGLTYRLRNHRLFDLPLTDIVRINFREGRLAMTLEKAGNRGKQKTMPIFGKKSKLVTIYDNHFGGNGWWITYPYKIPADPKTVAMILEAMSHWEVIKFVEESAGARTDLSKYGLSDPYSEITLLSVKRRYPMEINFGRPDGEDGPVFVKTSMNSKIVQIRTEALQTIQSLFNAVPSRRLVYFLDQVDKIEVLTRRWRSVMVRKNDIWAAFLQARLSYKKEQVVKRNYREKDERYFFSGKGIIAALRALEYIDTLNTDNPFYAGFQNAKQVMKFLFFKSNGNLTEVFKLFKPEDSDEIFYLQCQSNGNIYLINDRMIGVILSEIKKARTEKKRQP